MTTKNNVGVIAGWLVLVLTGAAIAGLSALALVRYLKAPKCLERDRGVEVCCTEVECTEGVTKAMKAGIDCANDRTWPTDPHKLQIRLMNGPLATGLETHKTARGLSFADRGRAYIWVQPDPRVTASLVCHELAHILRKKNVGSSDHAHEVTEFWALVDSPAAIDE